MIMDENEFIREGDTGEEEMGELENGTIKVKMGELEWVEADPGRGSYFRFNPHKLTSLKNFEDSPEITNQIIKTIRQIALYDKKIQEIIQEDVELFEIIIKMMKKKEAQRSSKIEGTIATIEDLEKNKHIPEKDIGRREHLDELIATIKALGVVMEMNQKDEKMTIEKLKEVHRIILDTTKGREYSPGEYKQKQNGIGEQQVKNLDDAKFVPASPEKTPELMEDLIKYINKKETRVALSLYKACMAHYQLETIHPFRDGNGRLGRLLILFILSQEKIMKTPIVLLSNYFENQKNAYFDSLFKVSSKGDVNQWFVFFLKVLEKELENSSQFIDEVVDLKKEIKKKILTKNEERRKNIANYILENSLFTAKNLEIALKIPNSTINEIIKNLEKENIISLYHKKSKEKLYIFKKLKDLSLNPLN